jgi:hypothetical protein
MEGPDLELLDNYQCNHKLKNNAPRNQSHFIETNALRYIRSFPEREEAQYAPVEGECVVLKENVIKEHQSQFGLSRPSCLHYSARLKQDEGNPNTPQTPHTKLTTPQAANLTYSCC